MADVKRKAGATSRTPDDVEIPTPYITRMDKDVKEDSVQKKGRVPVPWNSNPQAKERLRFYCVTSERTDRLNGIAPNFAARADTR